MTWVESLAPRPLCSLERTPVPIWTIGSRAKFVALARGRRDDSLAVLSCWWSTVHSVDITGINEKTAFSTAVNLLCSIKVHGSVSQDTRHAACAEFIQARKWTIQLIVLHGRYRIIVTGIYGCVNVDFITCFFILGVVCVLFCNIPTL